MDAGRVCQLERAERDHCKLPEDGGYSTTFFARWKRTTRSPREMREKTRRRNGEDWSCRKLALGSLPQVVLSSHFRSRDGEDAPRPADVGVGSQSHPQKLALPGEAESANQVGGTREVRVDVNERLPAALRGDGRQEGTGDRQVFSDHRADIVGSRARACERVPRDFPARIPRNQGPLSCVNDYQP